MSYKDWLSNVELENAEGDVKRKGFAIYIRKGNTGDWTWIGYKQESLAIANNYEEESTEDVKGDKWSEVTGKDEQIEMSECRINREHTAFLDTAFKYTLFGLEEYLNDYSIMLVFDMFTAETDDSGTEGKFARKVDDVTISLDNLGNQTFTTADVTIKGISEGTVGVATISDDGQPTFTAWNE